MARALFAMAAALVVASPSVAADLPAKRFIQAKRDGKWGMLDQSGRTILPFIYDFIDVDESGDISLQIGERYGKADARGQIFIPVSYQYLGPFQADGYATATSAGFTGLIDRHNQWAIPPGASWIERFDDGSLYAAQYKGKFGVLSLTEKKWVIPTVFSYIGGLARNGLALAKNDQGGAGFIDRDGRWMIPPGKFDDLQKFGDDDLAPAKMNGKWGFINANGEWAINPISDDIIWPEPFNDKGTTFVKVSGKYRLIDRAGQFVGSTAYDDTHPFKDGFAQVQVAGKWGLIDEQGEMVIAPSFESFTDFDRENLAAAFEGKKSWIIDRNGRRQFGTKFDRVGGFFGGGWAAASAGGKWGAIDTRGQWLVAPKYDCVRICFDGPPIIVVAPPAMSSE